MLLRFLRITCACSMLTALGFGAAGAQSAPTPAPTVPNDRAGAPATPATAPKPPPGWNPLHVKGLTISGTLRAYDFNRLNVPEYNAASKPPGAATGPNRQAFNFGGVIRADYKIGTSPFAVGGAIWGADPFGLDGGSVGCNVGGGLIVHQPQALCAANNSGIDNTLPGFPIETFEYYLKYSDPTASITIGNQLLNKAWAPASDSRIKPSLYQGVDATINVTKALSIGLTHIVRFEDRTQSEFDNCTTLTCVNGVTPVGLGGGFPNAKAPSTGADRVALTFKPNSRFTLLTENYRFHNIANLTYLESKFNPIPKNARNPFVAFQFVHERQTGGAQLGRIENQTVGVQFGVTAVKNVLFTVGADSAPWNYDTIVSAKCLAAPPANAYFLPGGGTTASQGVGACAITPTTNGFRAFRVAYGGLASPYSDSYATDPLYTTSISQGSVDRRSAGTSFKGALTYTSNNKRLVAIASEAIYDYDTNFARNRTYELDGDLTYNFNPVLAGAYRGFSIRERFADRTQPSLPYNFKYLRHQLQYSF